MALRGRRPLPTSVKALRGTLRRHRVNLDEPAPQPGMPAPPDFLGRDARNEWNRIASLLHERGLLERLDRATLTGYCTAWGDLAEATRILAEEGTTVVTPRGALALHPEMRRADRARAQLRAFAAEFGLSPSSRTRVSAGPPPGDPLSEREMRKQRFFGTSRDASPREGA